MARIRSIKPQFFRHRRLYVAEIDSVLPLRVAFAGLWTCADREGRFRWEPDELKLDCLPYDEVDFSRVLHALFTRGFIVRYASGGREYGVIPGFADHQIVNNREADSILPVPPDDLTQLIDEANEVDASITREPRVTIQTEGKGREGNRKGRDIPTRQETRASPEFEVFKKSFPRRRGSNPWKPALLLFEKAVRGGIPVEMINAAADAYRAECQRDGIIDTEKVAQAQTWLRQERYSDYSGATITPIYNIRSSII
jgi:hypothetical protein